MNISQYKLELKFISYFYLLLQTRFIYFNSLTLRLNKYILFSLEFFVGQSNIINHFPLHFFLSLVLSKNQT